MLHGKECDEARVCRCGPIELGCSRERKRAWRGRERRCRGLVEEVSELVADLAALGVVVFPLVCVDAEGGVGFAVSESALDVDEVVVECDQHAGVAVAKIVQVGLGAGSFAACGVR